MGHPVYVDPAVSPTVNTSPFSRMTYCFLPLSPSFFQSDDYDIFLHARSLKELGSTATSFRFRAPPEEIIRSDCQ